ncbi:hypothetical protein [Pseudokineococcus sp. 1T1Z-3]|uniref:hypothetical protein n=1 Tax=Pseudokineococcus sp. 1T1Z-3 TaxID=3132745 RepID=UPI0030B40220
MPAFVLRHARALADVVDTLVVASSAPLRPEAAAALGSIAEVVPVTGSSSCWVSWREGMSRLGDWRNLDRLLLVDSAVAGPFRPLGDVLGDVVPGTARGVCSTGPYLQSQLLDLSPEVLAAPAVHAFWTGVEALGPRPDAHLLQRNFSRVVSASGLDVEPLFRPRRSDRVRARALSMRRSLGQAVTKRGQQRRAAMESLRRPPVRLLDPMTEHWYRAIDTSLPYLDLSVLLEDPARVGREHMLTTLEAAHPEAMTGVRDYLHRLSSEALPRSKRVVNLWST